jgi:hypothetical protein
MKFLFLLFLMASQVFIKIESGEDVYIVNSYEQCDNCIKFKGYFDEDTVIIYGNAYTIDTLQ